ncbi:MAG: hypothetical protein ACMUHU_03360, partial [Thermoplasmatota archaeon]
SFVILYAVRFTKVFFDAIDDGRISFPAFPADWADPTFKSVQDPLNSARLGAGVTITKYTGRGGKIGANDASAEMVGSIRQLFNSEKVIWQMQETGRVDEGGGGTVAKFIAVRNMDVLDIGIPLLSMHSPFEVLSKADLQMGHRAFRVFFEKYAG